jgi:predicted phosphodiesterase
MKKNIIGIMADSHGRPDTIRDALAVFTAVDCVSIYHLGDICDSTRPETADACLRLLMKRRVQAIKGNNDQAILTNHTGRDSSPVSPQGIQALKKLELARYYQEAIFIHSLPFVEELGLSSIIGAMGPMEIRRFCNQFPGKILFRGHSHNPEIAWLNRQQVKSRPLTVGRKLNLSQTVPCVVTCGALTRGLCMLWNPEENYIESVSFR